MVPGRREADTVAGVNSDATHIVGHGVNPSGQTEQRSQGNLSGATERGSQGNLSGETERGSQFRGRSSGAGEQGRFGEGSGGFDQLDHDRMARTTGTERQQRFSGLQARGGGGGHFRR